jgi:hypothetical protein
VAAAADNERACPVESATEEALNAFVSAAHCFKNQEHCVPHEEQDEEQIRFPDFEPAACKKRGNLASEQMLSCLTCSLSFIILLVVWNMFTTKDITLLGFNFCPHHGAQSFS